MGVWTNESKNLDVRNTECCSQNWFTQKNNNQPTKKNMKISIATNVLALLASLSASQAFLVPRKSVTPAATTVFNNDDDKSGIIQDVKEGVHDGYDAVKETVKDGYDWTKETVKDGYGWTKDKVKSGYNAAKETIVGEESAQEKAEDSYESAKESAEDSLDAAKDSAEDYYDATEETAKAVKENFKEGLDEASD